MTGDVLRRLRVAYGLSADRVAKKAAMPVPALKSIERDGNSYAKTFVYKGKPFRGNIERKQRNFRRILNALRELRQGIRDRYALLNPRKVLDASFPRGTTHLLHGKPVRYVMKNGKPCGFCWENGWYRSAHVEDAAGKAVAV